MSGAHAGGKPSAFMVIGSPNELMYDQTRRLAFEFGIRSLRARSPTSRHGRAAPSQTWTRLSATSGPFAAAYRARSLLTSV